MPMLDSGYISLCQEFPLNVLHSLEDCIVAVNVIRRLQTESLVKLSDGQRRYMETLELLISEYRRSFEAYLCSHGQPDNKVLLYLMATFNKGYTADAAGIVKLANAINVPPLNLLTVLEGEDEFCRESIVKLAHHFAVPVTMFDHSKLVGRTTLGRRFRILDTGPFTIRDEHTLQEVNAGDGKKAVAVGDINTDTFFLNPDGLGFVEEWEYQLNAEPELTLELFFEATWASEQAEKVKNDVALRSLNRTRRMFYIINHGIEDGYLEEELFVAALGNLRTHEEWYEALDVSHLLGWQQHVRGAYYPSANLLLFYIGLEHTTNETVRTTALRWLLRVVGTCGIPGDAKIGLGAVTGPVGTIWKPLLEWGSVSDYFDVVKLTA
jgi:hypothetical protein